MDIEVPRRGIWDHVRGWSKVFISLIPYVGGAGAEVFEQAVPSPIEIQRDEWMRQFADRVLRLEGNSPIEFSIVARKIAEVLIHRSQFGRSGDPSLDQETIRAVAGVPDDDIAEAVCELEEYALVARREAIGMGRIGFIALGPTERLFVVFDCEFMGWNARDDAAKLARSLFEREAQMLSSDALCKELEWTPRRFNPAIWLLIENELVLASNTIDQEYITPWVRKLPRLGLSLKRDRTNSET
jgi:hypothetical protein